MTNAQKVLSITLSLVALATVGTAPALARTIHQLATQDSQQMYMYTGPDTAWSWPDGSLYERDGEIIAFAQPDLAVPGSGLSSAAPVAETRSIALSAAAL